ncbi:MAG: hypothetical protein HQL18_00185 [Candidatus Omnitrophica bacterium]|nr:hypothetical protein [Candidatus Omnitrophota bacterium]
MKTKKKPASAVMSDNFQRQAKGLFEKVKKFAVAQPVLFAGLLIAAIIFVCWLVSSWELWPEAKEPQPVQRGVVIEKGDSALWLGMEVAPVTRTIRKDFKIPGNIKGMFVINEGKELAGQYGVKTADVIVSISRRAVPTSREFIKVVNGVPYREGILLEIFRDGKSFYLTIPFSYQYGPLMGPNKGSWQLGSPLVGQGMQYGPVFR